MISNLIRLSIILSVCMCFAPAQAKVYKIATVSPDGLSWMKTEWLANNKVIYPGWMTFV
jgi:hypothetical protein